MLQERYDNGKSGFTRLNFSKNNLGGFTLVEALVAISVLTAAMTPLFAQVQASLRLSRTINQNLTASMLAQEGIELVRGIRDDNWFQGNPYDQDLTGCAGGCHLQYDDDVLSSGAGPQLELDPSGRYRYGGGIQTPYTREIIITTESDGTTDFLRVTSTVTWDVRSNTRQVVVEDFLFDWLVP